jgi:phosphatidylserine decarboxylase
LRNSITRIAAALGIAAEGAILTSVIALAGIVLLLFGLSWLGIPFLLIALAVGAFFRDPERRPKVAGDVVLSAADGRICEISQAPIPETGGTPVQRVSVFMSPLNVHINRAPVSGEVVMVKHTAGEFKAAFRDVASEHNERNVIIFRDPQARLHAIVQIAGYLARRIICRVQPPDKVEQGDRVGLIMFGSRVDHFIPLDYQVTVSAGERVRAGESVLARRLNDG